MAFPALPTHGKLARIGLATEATASTAGGGCVSTLIDYTSRWSINWTKDVVVYGRQGQEYKEASPGQAAYTGTGEMTFVNSSEQSTLIGMMISTSSVVPLSTGPLTTKVMKFYFDSTNNWLSASGIVITGVTIDAPVGDLIKCNFTFQGHGFPIQYAITTAA